MIADVTIPSFWIGYILGIMTIVVIIGVMMYLTRPGRGTNIE